MKILMLNYEFPPIGGGGGHAHRCLLEQFAARDDLEIDLVTSAPQRGIATERMGSNVSIHRVGIRKRHLHVWRRGEVIEWLLRARPVYRRLVRSGRHDLVHAFFAFPSGWLCHRTRRKLPYVISLRGSDVPGGNRRLSLDYKLLGPTVFKPIWRHAGAIVACSEGLKARALRFLPAAEIEVIPNGVDLERFHPAETDETGGQTLRLLTVGRLSATKRLPLLLDAVGRLGEQGGKVSLTVVGGGALQAELEETVAQKKLGDAVRLAGRAEAQAMPEMYRRHDVFVSASMQEGMSNAMLEAMASGLPIVTTRCEGVDEIITDNGVVVDEPEPGALAGAIGKIGADRETLRTMSVAARKRAEKFSWAAVAQAYLRLYETVQ